MSRKLRVLFGISVTVLVLIAAGAIAASISVPYYAITPGTGMNVASLIAVPRTYAHSHRGSVLLTDVDLAQLSAIEYPIFALDHNAQIVPASEINGSGSATQYDDEGVIDMVNAQQAATVVALHELGYAVHAVPSGVVVYAFEEKSVSSEALAIGDVIVAINGVTTTTLSSLEDAVHAVSPGKVAVVHYHGLSKSKVSSVAIHVGVEHVLGTGESAQVVCLSASSHSTLHEVEEDGQETPCLGIGVEQEYRNVGMPFSVSIDSDGIIGPSAGLAFTLGLIEKLDPGDLAGGMRIAATGTMSINGVVGDVGGVAQKTVAVRDAGASVFFVPPQEEAVAKAHAGAHLKVLAVDDISQAISDLVRLGGTFSKVGATS